MVLFWIDTRGALEETGEVTGRRLGILPAARRPLRDDVRNGILQRLFCATILLWAVRLDEQLFAKGLIPQITREYVFTGYECVVR